MWEIGGKDFSEKLSGRAITQGHDHRMGSLRFAIEINIVEDHRSPATAQHRLVAASARFLSDVHVGFLSRVNHDRSSHLSIPPSTLGYTWGKSQFEDCRGSVYY